MADRAQWDVTRPRTPEEWDALLDAKRERIGRSERVLMELVSEACPAGMHRPRAHRDSRPPWCDACGRSIRGVRVADAATMEPVVAADPDDSLEVLVVSFDTGVVHRWQCEQGPQGADRIGWSTAMAGHDDQACTACLPEGLPK